MMTLPEALISRNPATGDEIGRVPATDPGAVAGIAAKVRRAQADWAAVPIVERLRRIDRWRKALARDADDYADLIRDEVGKPRGEALGELVSTLDAMRWTVKHGRKALADRTIGAGWQRLMLLSSARMSWRPVGVVGMIGTWNYPIFLNAAPIAQALAAGNGVVWKPSELAPMLGARLQRSLDEAELPPGLVSAVFGGAEVGQALIDSGIDKGMFTGGIANGRRVLAELGARGIPALAELSGFDAAVVLEDADIARVAPALAWGAFVGAGQTCVAVKRIYVVGDPRPLAEAIAEVARSLRVGDPGAGLVDVGPMISEQARDRFDRTVREAIAAGAEVLAGARPIEGPGAFYAPTVLIAPDGRAEGGLCGCFGPLVVIRGVQTADQATREVNSSEYALAASVWGRHLRGARAVAVRLDAGMVGVNDAVTPSALAGAPFGGLKGSGFGRTKGELGLREFAVPITIQVRRMKAARPQLYPYSSRIEQMTRFYLRLMHRG